MSAVAEVRSRAEKIDTTMGRLRDAIRWSVQPDAALRQALRVGCLAAADQSVDYGAIARRIGCTQQCVKNWASGRSLPHSAELAHFLLGPVLPIEARVKVWTLLAAEVGLLVMPAHEAQADSEALQRQGLEVSAAAGDLAGTVAAVTSASGPGGRLTTSRELDELEVRITDVLQEASEMLEAVKRERAKRGGGAA